MSLAFKTSFDSSRQMKDSVLEMGVLLDCGSVSKPGHDKIESIFKQATRMRSMTGSRFGYNQSAMAWRISWTSFDLQPFGSKGPQFGRARPARSEMTA
jgi:hypothetical protein